MADIRGFEAKPRTEMLEQRISLITFPFFQRSIGIATDEEDSSRVRLEEFLKNNFEIREFMDKLTLKATSREVNRNMNCDRAARDIEKQDKESTGGDINDCYKRIQGPLPEDQCTSMSST